MKEGYGHGRSQSSVPLLPYTERTPPSTPFVSTFRGKAHSFSVVHGKRKTIFVLCAFVSVVFLGVLASWAVSSGSANSYTVPQHTPLPLQDDLDLASNAPLPPPLPETLEDDSLSKEVYSPFVRGPPTQSFRDNLRNDTKYITSWLSAGWSSCLGPHLFLTLH